MEQTCPIIRDDNERISFTRRQVKATAIDIDMSLEESAFGDRHRRSHFAVILIEANCRSFQALSTRVNEFADPPCGLTYRPVVASVTTTSERIVIALITQW